MRLSPLTPAPDKAQYVALSEFRYQLRRFLNFSETAARQAGLTPLQYLLMLHIQGTPGREWSSISELAERLQMKHNAVVGLVNRSVKSGLVTRQKNSEDGRLIEVHLQPEGSALLVTLAASHQSELASLSDTFQVARITAFNNDEQAGKAT